MFKRTVTIITLIATSTLFLNEIARARAFIPLASSTSVKERKKNCLPCAAAQGNDETDPLDHLATLGRRTQILPFAPLQRSVFDGTVVNLVSTATGQLSFAVTDLELNGVMPLTFQRAYNSDNPEDSGLGAGWSFVFDDRVTLNGDTATLSTGTGATALFRRDGPGRHFILKTSEPNAHQGFDLAGDDTIIEQAAGWTRTYEKHGTIYRLSRVTDANGNTIRISFNSLGNIYRIASSNGATLALEWSKDKVPQLLAVADSAGRRVTFRQEGHRLRAVTDAAGAEWAYGYQAGRLVRASDPLGRLLLRARYDRANRVVEAGDAAGMNLYEYDSASNDISRRTVVTDPLGAKTFFEHTERGSLSAVRNEAETLLQIDYNAANRPTRVANALSGDTVFNYDAENHLVNQASTDGAFQTYTYDERGQVSSTATNAGRTDYQLDGRGNVISARASDSAQSYQVVRNSRGQTLSVKSDAGTEVSFEYDAAGNTSAFSTSKAGRFQIETDAVGRITSERLPTGTLYRYEYDPRGRVTRQSDNRGRAALFERDASGAVTGVVMASGGWMRATRDEAGRIVAFNTSAGKSRHFAYDARGALTDYTDARGRSQHFSYDKRGRLESVEGDDGHHTVIERDEKGRVKRVWSFNLPKGGEGGRQEARLIARTRGDAQFLKTGYDVSLPLVNNPLEFECLFGSGDGFIDNSGWQFGWGGCGDPFGDWGGGEGGGSFDPFFAPAGESCVSCTARQIKICATRQSACFARVSQSMLIGVAGCISLAIAFVIGAVICGGYILGSGMSGNVACQLDYQACLLEAVGKCPSC